MKTPVEIKAEGLIEFAQGMESHALNAIADEAFRKTLIFAAKAARAQAEHIVKMDKALDEIIGKGDGK